MGWENHSRRSTETRLAHRTSLVYARALRSYRRRGRNCGWIESIADGCVHPDDHVLWRAAGGAPMFGFNIDPGPEPTIDLYQGQILKLGNVEFEVRFTPGHTMGHCIFYVAAIESMLLRRFDFSK